MSSRVHVCAKGNWQHTHAPPQKPPKPQPVPERAMTNCSAVSAPTHTSSSTTEDATEACNIERSSNLLGLLLLWASLGLPDPPRASAGLPGLPWASLCFPGLPRAQSSVQHKPTQNSAQHRVQFSPKLSPAQSSAQPRAQASPELSSAQSSAQHKAGFRV